MAIATSAENKEFAAAASHDRPPRVLATPPNMRARELATCVLAESRTRDWRACAPLRSPALSTGVLAKRRTPDWHACGPSCLRSDALGTGVLVGPVACEATQSRLALAGGVLAKGAVATGCLRAACLRSAQSRLAVCGAACLRLAACGAACLRSDALATGGLANWADCDLCVAATESRRVRGRRGHVGDREGRRFDNRLSNWRQATSRARSQSRR
jgi:hypothetical protein